MPEAWKSSSAALTIELAAPPNWTFAAGDTVIGSVGRSALLVTPEATVTLRLLGRAKTKIEVSRGNNRHDVYRSRFNFFTSLPPGATRRVVFRGPVHIPEGGAHSWPFSVAVPSAPWVSPVPGGPAQDSSFLPLTAADIPRHALPGTFRSGDNGFTTSSDCFVEYYLEAALRYSKGSSVEVATATLPLTLRHPSTALPITDFQLQPRGWDKYVRSYLLVPGQETARLSFRQKSQKLFGSSKVPQFQFTVRVAVPSVIQLDNPAPIPVQLLIVPRDGPGSAAKGASSPSVTLNHVKLGLRSETLVVAPGNWGGIHDDRQSVGRHLALEDAFRGLAEPVVIPSGDEPVDVGALLQLRLSAGGLYSNNKRLGSVPVIHPGFTTYNIRHRNTLKWTISYTVVGEKQKIEFESAVTILAPAECRQAPGGQPAVSPPQPSSSTSEPPPAFRPAPGPEEKTAVAQSQRV